MSGLKPHQYCSYCGNPYKETTVWPRKCSACKHVSFKNPEPVVVIIIPIYPLNTNKDVGVLSIRRADNKQLALVSGYVDYKEHWREAAIRELEEEIGLTKFSENQLILEAVEASSDKDKMLIFCRTPPLWDSEVPTNIRNDEVLEVINLTDPNKLVF